MRKRPLEPVPDKHAQHRDRKRRDLIPLDKITLRHAPETPAGGPKRKVRLHQSEGTSTARGQKRYRRRVTSPRRTASAIHAAPARTIRRRRRDVARTA
jgi:hypothetical protein